MRNSYKGEVGWLKYAFTVGQNDDYFEDPHSSTNNQEVEDQADVTAGTEEDGEISTDRLLDELGNEEENEYLLDKSVEDYDEEDEDHMKPHRKPGN